MSMLSKLFGHHDDKPVEDVACPHRVLTPRWDSAEDIGSHERATQFVCESCGESFPGDEGRRMLAQPEPLGGIR